MRQLPILFSTPMVQAILEDKKTMTRRTQGLDKLNILVKQGFDFRYDSIEDGPDKEGYVYFERLTFTPNEKPTEEYRRVKPKYQIGDQIWVKESYYAYGYWKIDGKTKTGKEKLKFIDCTSKCFYKYDYYPNIPETVEFDRSQEGWWKRNSLFMPKKAARIWLECTGVRCERLMDISESDAKAEGATEWSKANDIKYLKGSKSNLPKPCGPFKFSFILLWCKINGVESFDSNPWIFVYSFKRIEKP